MADIELVIKIPEEDYHRIASGFGQEEDAVLFEKIFKNGTPLPEHHGDLIDVEIIKNELVEMCPRMCYGCGVNYIVAAAETIIPATKEGD